MKTDRSIILISVLALVIIVSGFWYLTRTTPLWSQSSGSSNTVGSTTTTSTVSTTTTHASPVAEQGTPAHVTKGSGTTAPTKVGLAPYIQEFLPAGAAPGTVVTIKGVDFDPTTNYVTFGSTQGRHRSDGSADNVIATEGSADGVTLTFTVPSSGPSGLLCDAQNSCIAVSSVAVQPGTYPVTVRSKYGTSYTEIYTVTK